MASRSTAFLLLGFAAMCFPQAGDRDEQFVENTFRSRIQEVPQLGWIAPGYGFVAQTDAPTLVIYGRLGTPRSFSRAASIRAGDIQQDRLACELPADTPLTRYTPQAAEFPDRALYTSKPLPGDGRAGLLSVPLDRAATDAVNESLNWPKSGSLRRDEAVAVRPGASFYSLHRLYDSETGLLKEEGLVLHRADGRILALDVKRDLSEETLCDGCALPEYSDGGGILRVLNAFELPGFPYPLLLFDSSTIEGRALSLFTFTPAGKPSEFRVYEYVVNCG